MSTHSSENENENKIVAFVNDRFGYDLQEKGIITPYYWTYTETFYILTVPGMNGYDIITSDMLGE